MTVPATDCLLCAPLHGWVLDPFVGSGTTLLTAQALGRHAIGCDLSYHDLSTLVAPRLIGSQLPLLQEVP